MELIFSHDYEFAKLLDDIMNSYPGRDRGSIMAEKQSMSFMLLMLEQRQISVTEHAYPYDISIRDDSEMMETYSELARETRWRQFSHTEIEGIRINALRQLQQNGKPSYDGEFICYRDGRICVHCGNLHLHSLLMYLAAHEQVGQFYLFTYPYWTEDQTAKYYRFDLSATAISGTVKYRESIWDKMRKASESTNVFPKIPQLTNAPSSSS